MSSGYTGAAAPSLSGYTFSPANRAYTGITGNQAGQNYTGTPVASTVTVSGTIRNSSGQGIPGVMVTFTNGPTATSDANGLYSGSVVSGYTGFATPSLAGYSFTPANRSYTSINSVQSGQDYAGTAASTLTLTITEYPIPTPGSQPVSITLGSDGALWFTESHKIGRITTAGLLTEFLFPISGGFADQLVTGSDGAIWFTGNGYIGRVASTGGITTYPVPPPSVGLFGITNGPDGAMWFTNFNSGKVGRITTAGSIQQYAAAGGFGITTGQDGALWFAGGAGIGRISTDGTFTFYYTGGSNIAGITSGPDGALWFVGDDGIGRITTSGLITRYSHAVANNTVSLGIVTGPDGALWFTEPSYNKIGRITTAGVISEFDLPTSGGFPSSIAVGPDGTLWFTEEIGNKIGRAALTSAVTTAPVISSISNSAININLTAAAPGELITIKGSNLGPASPAGFNVNGQGGVNSTLTGVQVLFGSTPGTPTYVSASQINVIVPWELAGQNTTTLVVSNNGAQSQGVSVPVVSAAPDIYTFGATGAGQAAALNLTGPNAGTYNGPATGLVIQGVTISASPAAPGSYISLFLTGGRPNQSPQHHRLDQSAEHVAASERLDGRIEHRDRNNWRTTRAGSIRRCGSGSGHWRRPGESAGAQRSIWEQPAGSSHHRRRADSDDSNGRCAAHRDQSDTND